MIVTVAELWSVWSVGECVWCCPFIPDCECLIMGILVLILDSLRVTGVRFVLHEVIQRFPETH